ncbi:MAG: endonuclease domain-containing protein [Nitrospirota bacterium]
MFLKSPLPQGERAEGEGVGFKWTEAMKRKNIGQSRALRKHQTDAEKKLWMVLRNRRLAGVKFRRQFPFDRYILDFYSPEYKICVEADGGQHYINECFQKDVIRTKNLSDSGIQVLRFSDRDILINIEGICEVIHQAIVKAPSPQSSPLRGEEVKNYILN